MRKINTKQLPFVIRTCYKQTDFQNKKFPIIIYGTFGIGKSFIIYEEAKAIAKSKGKEFIDFNRATFQQKEDLIKNPTGKFVFLDIRLSEYDTSDIKGLPDFKEANGTSSDSIIWKSPFWTKILENPEADGIILFDEINLATPLVISSIYKILHDRIINDRAISPNFLMISAGNKDDDKAYTHELASPVRDRAVELELSPPTAESWIEDFAIPNDIDSRIIGFITWKPSYLRSVDFDSEAKFTTPRGWARLNALIHGIEKYEDIELLSSTAIGEGIAREFVAFCKIKDTIKLEEVIKNPREFKKIDAIDIRYFVITAIAEKYKDKSKKNEVTFEKLMELSEVLDEMNLPDYVTMFLRLAIKYAGRKFDEDFTAKANNFPIIKKYNKVFLSEEK